MAQKASRSERARRIVRALTLKQQGIVLWAVLSGVPHAKAVLIARTF